jgi:hypothetical protein
MVKRLLAGPWEQIKQRFPDRQIYHRTEGQVRYFAITTEMQLSAIGGVCLLAVWLSLTTVGMLLDGRADQRAKQQFAQIEAEYQNEVDEARAAEAAAIAYMESRTDAFDRTAGEFQMRHDTLRRLLDFADDLSVGEERESPSLDEGRILMAASPADPDPRQALVDPVGEEAFDGLAEERVAALLADQEAALAEAENAAERRLENLRAVLRLTGMRVDEAMQEGPLEDEDGGTGGPLISLDQAPLFSDALNLDDRSMRASPASQTGLWRANRWKACSTPRLWVCRLKARSAKPRAMALASTRSPAGWPCMPARISPPLETHLLWRLRPVKSFTQAGGPGMVAPSKWITDTGSAHDMAIFTRSTFAAAMRWSWAKDWGGWDRPDVPPARISIMKSGSAANTLTPKIT